MSKLTRFLVVAAAVIPLSTPVFAAGDSPVSSDGSMIAVPTGEAVKRIMPSFGTGETSLSELRMRGATMGPNTPFPESAMDTVASGKVGKQGESIINWDSRTRAYTTAYPNRAIVFIEYNGQHMCTGWMYSPSMVATAGHCVHSGGSSGSWYTRSLYRVYAGRDGTVSPYGSCTVSRTWSVQGWTVSNNFRFDYGAMRLNCTIGNTVGWFGMYDNTAPIGTPAIIGGYPGDKPRTQWTSADKIRSASAEMLAYRMDTVGGHSGSPIWHDRDEALATSGAWAIGVHNYGVGAFGTQSNSSARLTQVRINNYVGWRNAP